jgi:hypothetical protein
MATDFQTKSVVNVPELSATQTPSAWAISTNYTAGNYVIHNGVTYKASSNHTATNNDVSSLETDVTNAGSGYSAGTKNTTNSGSGTGATVTITVDGGEIQTATISDGGSGYSVGDVLTVVGGTDGKVTVKTLTSGNSPSSSVWEESNVSGIVDLVSVYTGGEVTVHAIYVSNKHTGDVHFYLQMRDGSNNHKGYILYNVVVPAQSSMVIEKPINLTASDTASDQRKLSIYASAEEKLDVMASVLVIS